MEAGGEEMSLRRIVTQHKIFNKPIGDALKREIEDPNSLLGGVLRSFVRNNEPDAPFFGFGLFPKAKADTSSLNLTRLSFGHPEALGTLLYSGTLLHIVSYRMWRIRQDRSTHTMHLCYFHRYQSIDCL